jgi:hypothetical protein
MTFPGRQFSGSLFNFKTKGGDGVSADAVPVHAIDISDIVSAFIPSVNATTEIVAAAPGKAIEIVSIICTADASLQLRLESWNGSTATSISPNFDVTTSKDFRHGGELCSVIAKSATGESVRLALTSGTGNFTGWVQYRLA